LYVAQVEVAPSVAQILIDLPGVSDILCICLHIESICTLGSAFQCGARVSCVWLEALEPTSTSVLRELQ